MLWLQFLSKFHCLQVTNNCITLQPIPANFLCCQSTHHFLGEFSVTCIAYHNLLVIDPRTHGSPILLGPILIHQQKTSETYHFIASTLVGLSPVFASVLAFCTDGEEVVVKAFKQQLTHARCFCHMKLDIQKTLCEDDFQVMLLVR